MNAIDLLRLAFDDLHTAIREDLEDVSDDWLYWQPAPGLNHIAFLLWHLVRDEDVVVSWSVRHKPQVWEAGGWPDQLGLDHHAQGTGFDPADLGTIRYGLPDFMVYVEAVWAETDAGLQTLTESDLDQPVVGFPSMSVASQLTTGSVAHGWVHLGEIRSIKGLKGWRFRE
jgi:DinB superfamily